MAEYRTRVGRYIARVDRDWRWRDRTDFAWLGTIDFGGGRIIGWAWHLDGRSIDRSDDGFDLIDFPQERVIAETVAADG